MSLSFQKSLKEQFGNDKWSDCSVIFCIAKQAQVEGDERGTKRQKTSDNSEDSTITIGRPLPAHLVVVCGGSALLEAQASRWTEQKGPSEKPQLRLLVDSEDDIDYALSALRYVYSGQLDVDRVSALLRVRRLASYLQVEGCVEACDAAVAARIAGTAASSTGPVRLDDTVELYNCRDLLQHPSVEPQAVQSFMKACRKQLLNYSKSSDINIPLSSSGTSFAELLAWVFGDAPSVLSDQDSKRRMLSLPAAAMEALLGSNSFGTDSEDSVLLMLAEWLQANLDTPEAIRNKLCRLVRLSQLSNTYLHGVLPLLSWFPISAMERNFLCQYRLATNAMLQSRLMGIASGKYDCKSPWYATSPRPGPSTTAPRSYEWSISQADLELAQGCEETWVGGRYGTGLARIAAAGFLWRPYLCIVSGEEVSIQPYLACCLPTALRITCTEDGGLLTAASPGPARLVVFQWQANGSRQEAWCGDYEDVYVSIGKATTINEGLPLLAAGKQAGRKESVAAFDPASWAPYLRDGIVNGLLEWSWTKP